MAWTYNNRVIAEHQAWTDDNGIQHPAQWSSWSTEDKTAMGLVYQQDQQPQVYDSRFYWDHGIPRAIEDRQETDGDGNPVLDHNSTQLVTPGLKTNLIRTVKAQASGLLAPTDWMIVRSIETDTPVDAEILQYRASVRTRSNEIQAAITACTTLEEIIALHESTDGSNPAITNWPQI